MVKIPIGYGSFNDQAKTFFLKSNNIKLLLVPVDDHRSIGVVERLIQRLKRRLRVTKIDPNNITFKIASSVAEIIKTLRISPHRVTKTTPFEGDMGRKANTPLSNITTNSSPNNLNWENAKHACLDRKNLIHPLIPAAIKHNLQRWSEDEANIKHKIPEPIIAKDPGTADNRPQTTN